MRAIEFTQIAEQSKVGRIIYTGSAQSITLPRGVYMVHLGGKTQKVVL